MSDPLPISPVTQPLTGTVRPPGSKSLTNRALIVAALADGGSELTGVLDSQDTQVMLESLARLGFNVQHDQSLARVSIKGCGGTVPAGGAELWLENSGTSIRFLTALCAAGQGEYRLDGSTRMRERPIGDLIAALNQLGGHVTSVAGTDCPPVRVIADGLRGGTVDVPGSISSQFLSAVLMAAPTAANRVDIQVAGTLVSVPYVEMTLAVMRQFGVEVEYDSYARFSIEPQRYAPTRYAIEPDASAASYFFAAAAVTGGEITVEGLTRDALQGDVGFIDALAEMGCTVIDGSDSITVRGGPLRGIDIDMNAISDTAQTLAAIAPFAEGPTRIRNVAHMRHKETDRISALVIELRRLGARVDEFDDGLMIHPGPLHPATIETYDDHRMAMSFAITGLKSPGIQIADPGCTAKTYPRFFEDLAQLTDAS